MTSAVYNVVNVVVISAVTRFIDAENLSRFFDAHIGSNQKLDRAFWVSIEAEGEVSSPPFYHRNRENDQTAEQAAYSQCADEKSRTGRQAGRQASRHTGIQACNRW